VKQAASTEPNTSETVLDLLILGADMGVFNSVGWESSFIASNNMIDDDSP
jgi:hypothetical protein